MRWWLLELIRAGLNSFGLGYLWRMILYLFLLFVVEDIHKFLQNLLVLTVYTHIHFLVILSQRLFIFPISKISYLLLLLLLLFGLFVGGEIDVS